MVFLFAILLNYKYIYTPVPTSCVMNVDYLETKFEETFGTKNKKVFFAPGRVNLIGEHIDYNGGNVLPCAISYGTYLAFSQRNDNILSLASTNFDFKINIDINQLNQDENQWVKYPEAIVDQFLKKNIKLSGMNMLFSGNIPTGAGLSSSASVELVTAVAINEHFKCNLSTLELIKMSQRAENNFVGVSCGIMDQFAVGMAKENNALHLNCNTLDYTFVNLNLHEYSIIIADTKKQRLLADSQYNQRCLECEQALKIISAEKPINYLCELSMDEFASLGKLINDPILFARARHVVSENDRVDRAMNALNNNDINLFGELMIQSHLSLKNDYQVTGFELDTMFELALNCEGVIGTRMTGAGFGGCTITLIENSKIDKFIAKIKIDYEKITGLKPEFYIVNASNGAARIK